MIFQELRLQGAFVIELEPHQDERGFFARSFCCAEFAKHGLATSVNQCGVSFNAKRGTLRGLHYQAEPRAEEKLVRCSRGAVYDVIVDLRPDSPTLRQWASVELSAENHRMLYVPRGFAHGFQTLVDQTELHYQISVAFQPEASRGLRWDDPALAIEWPDVSQRIISERDRNLPFFEGGPEASTR